MRCRKPRSSASAGCTTRRCSSRSSSATSTRSCPSWQSADQRLGPEDRRRPVPDPAVRPGAGRRGPRPGSTDREPRRTSRRRWCAWSARTGTRVVARPSRAPGPRRPALTRTPVSADRPWRQPVAAARASATGRGASGPAPPSSTGRPCSSASGSRQFGYSLSVPGWFIVRTSPTASGSATPINRAGVQAISRCSASTVARVAGVGRRAARADAAGRACAAGAARPRPTPPRPGGSAGPSRSRSSMCSPAR